VGRFRAVSSCGLDGARSGLSLSHSRFAFRPLPRHGRVPQSTRAGWVTLGLYPSFRPTPFGGRSRRMAAQLDAACEPSDGEQQPRAVLVRVHAPDSADEYVEHEFASAFEAAQWAHGRAAGRVRRTRVLYSGRGTIQSGCSGSICTSTSHSAAHLAFEWLAPQVRDGLTELLLGRDGAAALEHVITIYREQLQAVPICDAARHHFGGGTLSEVTARQLLVGLVGLACLQHVTRVPFSTRGALEAAGDEYSDWGAWQYPDSGGGRRGQGDVTKMSIMALKDELCSLGGDSEGCVEKEHFEARIREARAVSLAERLRRWARIAGMAYGRAHDQLLGRQPVSALDFLNGNKTALIRELGLESEDDVLAAQWGAHGPHEPGFVLVADRRSCDACAPCGHLVLAIRGTLSAADALTDLRCDAGEVALGGSAQRVHTGMWESAVMLDSKVRETIQAALAEGGVCHGMQLVVVGHSLGGGVASLLAIRWRCERILASVEAFAFAPPCVVSPGLAREAEGYITSVVLRDDAVCRWSLGSTKDACQAATLLVSKDGTIERLIRIRLCGFASSSSIVSDTSGDADWAVSGGEVAGEWQGGEGWAREAEAAEDESNDDVGWCKSVGEEVEACMTSEKLVPAGKIIWIIGRHLARRQEPPVAYGLGDSSKQTVTPQGPRSVSAVRASRLVLMLTNN